jgi:1-acyl-sn-glycerol-3-phosphate acyltransferase
MSHAVQLLRSRRFHPLFLTQLLGALNDNLFKSALVMTITFGVASRSGVSLSGLLNLASALLILPFFVFSALAGQLADKLEKSRLVRALKLAEAAIMVVATVGFLLESVPLLLVALFLMGTQSAFFGPVKYAILPQHLRDEELVAGNGLVEMGTFVAILAGTIVGGLVIAIGPLGPTIASGLVLATAAAGWVASRRIPPAPAAAPALRIDWNAVRATRDTLRIAGRDRSVLGAVLAASWFWLFGALFLTQFPIFARDVLGGGELTVTWLLAIFSMGIGAGSVACERIARGRIELALVPLAAVSMTVFAADLAIFTAPMTAAGEPTGPLSVPPRVAVDLFLLGASGGLFIVPLYALMQRRSREHERSRVVAANNIANALFMVVAAGAAVALRAAGMTVPELFLVTAAANGVVAVVAAVWLRRWLLRVVISVLVRTTYRVRARGLERIPDAGPALLVCNHPSFADAVILGGLCPRPVRFVMYHGVFRIPALRWFFRLVRAIPIAPRREDPEVMEAAFDEIDRALAAGELVCIFPEGKVTRDGRVDEFRPGFERILARRPVPVVPLGLRGMWGSFFSWKHGPPMRSWPRRFWARIEVVVGAALPPAGLAAETLRREVLALSHGPVEGWSLEEPRSMGTPSFPS